MGGKRKSKHKGSPGKSTVASPRKPTAPVVPVTLLQSLKEAMKKCIAFSGKPKDNPLCVFLSTENATREEGWLHNLWSPEASPRNRSLSEAQKLLLSSQCSILPKDVGLMSHAWGLNSRSIMRQLLKTLDDLFSSILPYAEPTAEDSRLVLSPVPAHLARRKRIDNKRTPVLGDISNSNRNPQFAGGNKQRKLFAMEATEGISKESTSRADAACQTTVIQVEKTCQTPTTLSRGVECQTDLELLNECPSTQLQGLVIQTLDALAKTQSSKNLIRISLPRGTYPPTIL